MAKRYSYCLYGLGQGPEMLDICEVDGDGQPIRVAKYKRAPECYTDHGEPTNIPISDHLRHQLERRDQCRLKLDA